MSNNIQNTRKWVLQMAESLQHQIHPPVLKVSPNLHDTGNSVPATLLFSPHPDDEVITGALARRLQRECGFRIINVAVTLGSNPERQEARLQELRHACGYLNWELEVLRWSSLRPGVVDASQQEQLMDLLKVYQPAVVFYPHAEDHHPTHIAVHELVQAALNQSGIETVRIQTEFWRAMEAPNLLVESSVEDVTDLVDALSCHVGEVQRNPYHFRLPAWMIDDVRRGAELICGKGAAAPSFPFGTLYHVDPLPEEASQILSSSDSLRSFS